MGGGEVMRSRSLSRHRKEATDGDAAPGQEKHAVGLSEFNSNFLPNASGKSPSNGEVDMYLRGHVGRSPPPHPQVLRLIHHTLQPESTDHHLDLQSGLRVSNSTVSVERGTPLAGRNSVPTPNRDISFEYTPNIHHKSLGYFLISSQ